MALLSAAGESGELPYDQLVLALGAMTNRNVIHGSQHAFTFKSLADALLLRSHIIECFERADVPTTAERKKSLLTFVVIGGGLVGVEFFGELTAFVDGIAPYYKHVDRREARFILLQGGERVMPEIDPSLAAYGARELAARPGADIRTSTRVQSIEPGKVHLPQETIAAGTIVLAAGILPSPVVAGMNVAKDKAGRILVDGAMRLPVPPGGLGDWRLCGHTLAGRQALPESGSACPARSQGAGRQHLLGSRRPSPAALPLSHPGHDGIAGQQEGVCAVFRHPGSRFCGLVCKANVLHDANARLGPAAAHHNRLDLRAVLSTGHCQNQPGYRGGRA